MNNEKKLDKNQENVNKIENLEATNSKNIANNESLNSNNNTTLKSVKSTKKEEILNIIAKQKANFQIHKLKPISERIDMLKRLRKNILEFEEEICNALKLDLNKSKEESYMAEIGMALDEISYMIKNCKRFAQPKLVKTPLTHFPATSFKIPSPFGVVLVVSPWNYPFLLSIQPLVDAITAGNLVTLKPSEFSPNVSIVIDKLISATFKPEEVSVIQGGIEEATFLLDQNFDYIFFTGSTRVGKIVMQKAAEHFTPVTLELGGKSPCIVDKTADIKSTARRIIFGKLLNCGQTCVAPDYVLCDKEIKDKLIEELINQIKVQYGTNVLENENYPRMINERQFNSMFDLIEQDKVIFGGKSNLKTLKIEPTLLNSTFSDNAMQAEIFGPILPILTYDDFEKLPSIINSMGKPLALYIFSKSKKNQQFIINTCEFGGGCINDTIMHIANHNLGFGGLKESGIGAYHGKVGFDTFSHYKSILSKKLWLDLPVRYQPISKFKFFLLRLFLR